MSLPAAVVGCELCETAGGELIVSTPELRIVLVDDQRYPGFLRVIWLRHVTEMTALVPAERSRLMTAVCKAEQALREVMQPHKINLASLGNLTPHLHWHVIPRFADDAHFPQPIWGQVQRATEPAVLAQRRALLPALRDNLLQQMQPVL